MKKINIRLISLLLVLCMVASMFEAPLAMFTVNATDTPETPTIPGSTKDYFTNSFENYVGSTDEIDTTGLVIEAGEGNVAEVKGERGYALLIKKGEENPTISTALAASAASNVVVQVALATTALSGAALKLTGTAAEGEEVLELAFVSVDAEGNILTLGNDTGKDITVDGTFVTVTVAINADNNAYSLWVGDEQVVHGKLISATAFGKVSNVAIELNGDITGNAENGTNLMVDDLKVYSYADVDEVYYNNDFSANADGMVLGTASKCEDGALKIAANEAASWNTGANAKALSNKFVVSFDLKIATKNTKGSICFVDANGEEQQIIYINTVVKTKIGFDKTPAGATSTYQYSSQYALNTDIAVTMIFDMAANTYDAYIGDTKVGDDLSFPVNNASFGAPQGIVFKNTNSDKDYQVDNLKVYEGTEKRTDFTNVPDTTVIPAAVDTYLYDSFEGSELGSYNISGMQSDVNSATVKVGNHYLHLEKGATSTTAPYVSVPLGELVDSDYVVVSADVASNAFVDTRFYLNNDKLCASFKDNVVYWNDTVVKSGENDLTVAANDEFINVTIVLDSVHNTYAFWLDGKMAQSGDWTNGRLTELKIALHGTSAEVVRVDSLKVYSYDEQFGDEPDTTVATTEPTETPTTETPTTEAPTTEAPTEPLKVYYNNDFNTNADGISFKAVSGNAINYSKHELNSGEGYLYLRSHSHNGDVAYWNRGSDGKAVLELPEKFVVSFDHSAMNKWANWRLYLVDENGKQINILWQNATGDLRRFFVDENGETVTEKNYLYASTEENAKVYPIALAFDMTTKTYSYYGANGGLTGSVENLNVKLPVPEGFGTVQYVMFTCRGDDLAEGVEGTPGNLCIDNFKVYSGSTVLDTVGPQDQFPPEPETPTGPTEPAPELVPGGDKVFYNNDFNTNADGIDFTTRFSSVSAVQYSKHELVSGEGYLYLRVSKSNDSVMSWNKGADGQALIPLTDQFVVSFDHTAMNKWSNWSLYLVDEEGDKIQILWNMGNSALKRMYLDAEGKAAKKDEHSLPTSNADGMNWRNVTVSFDMTSKTYSYWAEGYRGAEEVIEDLFIKLPDASGKFGTPQYIEIYSRGDDVEEGTAGNLMIDNLKIYNGTKPLTNVGPQNQFAPEPEPTEPPPTLAEGGDKVFYNNDFNTNASGIDFATRFGSISAIQYSKHELVSGEGYIYLRVSKSNDPVMSWNKGADGQALIPLTDKFVVSFDHTAMNKWSNWSLYLVDEDGDKMQILWNMGNSALKRFYLKEDGTRGSKEHSLPTSNADGMNWRNVTVSFDMTSKTYSYWCEEWNEENVTEELFIKIPDASGEFGTPQYIEIYSRGDDVEEGTAGNLMIDNLKIYNGSLPLDTVGAQNQFAPEPEPTEPPPTLAEGGDKVFYNNDFNTNADGIDFTTRLSGISAVQYSKHELVSGEGYLYLRVSKSNDPVMSWNKGADGQALIPLTDQFVVSFDHTAMNKWSNWSLYLVDKEGDKIQILWNMGNSALKRFYLKEDGTRGSKEHSLPTSNADGMNWRNVTVSFDMTSRTYSYWAEGYRGAEEVIEELFVKLPDASGKFGTPQYIEIYSRGDDVEEGTAGNLMIDNLKIYNGSLPLESVGPQNQVSTRPEPTPSEPAGELIEAGDKVYYNNNFNTNADGITFATLYGNSVNYSEHKLVNGEGYLYVRAHNSNDATISWNKGADGLELPNQFVISFDFSAYKKWSNFSLYLVDESGNKLRVLWNQGNGALKRYYIDANGEVVKSEHSIPVTNEEETNFRNVTLSFDMTNKVYSYWCEDWSGNGVVEDLFLKLPDAAGTFGKIAHIEFYSRGDDVEEGAVGNAMIDNLKIYNGTKPIANVGPQNVFPPEPEPVKVWYNNDFNTNADGISFIGSSEGKHVLQGGEGYIYLRRVGDTKVAYWNRGTGGMARAKLDSKFMISFDMCSTAMSDGTLSIVDEKGETIEILYFHSGHNYVKAYRSYQNEEGAWVTGISNVGYNYTDGRTHRIDVYVDTDEGTFSIWWNGNQVRWTFNEDTPNQFTTSKLYLNDSDFTFGAPQYIVFSANDTTVGAGDDGKDQYIQIDNLSIYGGNEPRTDVGPVTEQPQLPEEVGGFPPVVVDPDKVGTNVYYNNDFSKNSEGIYFANASSSVPLNERKNIQKRQDGMLYLKRVESGQPSAYWNRADDTKGKLKISDYVVISFDLSAVDFGIGYLRLFGNEGKAASLMSLEGERIRFYRIKDDGRVGFSVMEGKLSEKAVRVDLAINTESGTYSAWLDGTKLFTNERFIDPENFGNLQYIRWYIHNSKVDEKENIIPATLMIDNLQIYDGLEPKDRSKVGEVNVKYEFPRPEGIDPGNGLYYESDLEDKSTAELTLIGGSEITKEPNGNHSIEMKVGSWFSWNYLEKWEPSEYVVYEVTVKQVYEGTLLFRVSSAEGNSFYPIKFRKTGEITPGHATTEEKLKNGEEVRVSVAINAVDNTYSVWYDGILVLENSRISSTQFGTLKGFRFDVTDGDLAKTEWRVDNIRIYQGFCPEDYANVVQLKEQIKDESWLEEMQGTQSSWLDYATEELAIIKTDGAIMVNTNTLYIYKNGKRIQGTKAEVDAILKNTAGKKVIKNGLGLVIICSTSLDLTDAQIQSLHNYMVYTRPSASTIESLFKSVSSEHPRVILNKDRLAKLRADYKKNDMVKDWVDKLIARADLRLKSRHVEFSDESFTRSFRDNWTMLSLVYLLTGEAKYKDWLWEDILGATKFPNWKPNDGLANGDASFGIAIAYDWLYDTWTPEQRKIMEEAIYDKILYYAHRAVYGKGSGIGTYWASDTNRNAVSNGGRGMAMLAIFDAYPDKITDILEKTYHLLEIMMVEFAPDGANLEGPAYWEYQMQYLVPFLQSTLNTFGTDFNIMDAPGFVRTVDFYLDVDGMTGVNNFHDATADDHGVAGAALGLADLLGRPDLIRAILAKMDIYGIDEGMWSLINLNTDVKYDGTVDKELDAYYRGLEFVSMRSSWLNSAGISVSAHSGENGISHSHLDAGAFVLDIGGQRFASDYGKESYNLAASSNVNYQYYYFRKRAEGHNVFVINPDLKEGKDLGQATKSSDVVSKFVTKSRGAYAIMPLDSAYAGYAESATRGIMLGDDRKSVLIRDEIRGMKQKTNDVWWFLQLENVEIEISKDGKSAILHKEGVDVHMQVVSDAKDWEIKILEAKEMVPLEGLPDVDKQTPNPNFTRLAIVFKAGKNVNINVKFAEVGDPRGDTPIKDVALAKWSIPDGILKADPVLDGVEIGGVPIPDFKKNQTFYNFELPYGTEECPDIKVIGGEGCNIEIIKPTKLPGYLRITVTSKADSKLQTVYKIMLTVSGPISVQVSDTPQAANHARNMLDGKLTTRWAVNGAGWAKFTFPSPQYVDAVWLASWEQTQRVQPFNIEVSEDGVNFKEVWKGTTTMLPEGSKDQLQEFKIPAGMYKSIRLNFTGARYADGREYSWTSVLEVMFYYQGKPIEIILQTSDPDSGFTDNPNDNVNDGDVSGVKPTEPTEPSATEPSDVVDDSNNGNTSGMIWLIVGLGVAAILVAGAIVLIVLKKKKAAAVQTEVEQTEPETPDSTEET